MRFRKSVGKKSTHEKNASSSRGKVIAAKRVMTQNTSENVSRPVKKFGPLMPVWG